MSKNSLKKRKNRERVLSKKKNIYKANRIYNKKYPNIYVSSEYSDIEFLEGVKSFINEVRVYEFPLEFRNICIDLKLMSYNELRNKYKDKINGFRENMRNFKDSNEDIERYINNISKSVFISHLFEEVESFIWVSLYCFLKDNGLWDRFTPENHIYVSYIDGDIEVQVNSFYCYHSSYGKGYYTKSTPKVNVNDKKYTIAASIHCVERMHSRIGGSSEWVDPYGMYSLMSVANFTPMKLTNGSDALRIEFLHRNSGCRHLLSYAHKFAFDIYGRVPNKFLYLLGYAPLGFGDDEFIYMKTFLEPGMLSTPERVLMKTVDYKTSIHYKDILRDSHISEEYTKMRLFFHENDCKQITICEG